MTVLQRGSGESKLSKGKKRGGEARAITASASFDADLEDQQFSSATAIDNQVAITAAIRIVVFRQRLVQMTQS